MKKELTVFQAKDGSIELKKDVETIWATQSQIADIFGIDRSNVSRHLKNIFQSEELDKKVVCAYFTQTTQHGAITGKTQTSKIDCYNLDIILSVGYRTNSSVAIRFRKWATKTLKQHITQGFTINRKKIKEKHTHFLKAVEDIKLLLKNNASIQTDEALELIKTFSYTWFSLDSYDKEHFPKKGTKKNIKITAKELYNDLEKLKKELIYRKEATDLFAKEKKEKSLEEIIGNVFQSVFGNDAYETVEEKSAHLLYFIIKNHPFLDGNKRSGAFAFIWFLQKVKFDFQVKIAPETLTILTILIAESSSKEKDKIIGVILLLLNF